MNQLARREPVPPGVVSPLTQGVTLVIRFGRSLQTVQCTLRRIQGAWQAATETSAAGCNPASFTFQLSGVSPGVHIVAACHTIREITEPYARVQLGT